MPGGCSITSHVSASENVSDTDASIISSMRAMSVPRVRSFSLFRELVKSRNTQSPSAGTTDPTPYMPRWISRFTPSKKHLLLIAVTQASKILLKCHLHKGRVEGGTFSPLPSVIMATSRLSIANLFFDS